MIFYLKVSKFSDSVEYSQTTPNIIQTVSYDRWCDGNSIPRVRSFLNLYEMLGWLAIADHSAMIHQHIRKTASN